MAVLKDDTELLLVSFRLADAERRLTGANDSVFTALKYAEALGRAPLACCNKN